MTDEVEIKDEATALNILKKHNIPEVGNGHIVQPWPFLADEVKRAILYLCAEWDFSYNDTALITQKIKELEWQSAGMGLIVANTAFGCYGIEPHPNARNQVNKYLLSLPTAPREDKPVKSIEHGKALATIDFAKRVRACTTPLVTEE